MRVLGVHGVGQANYVDAPSRLETQWFDALALANPVLRKDFSLAFYAQTLQQDVHQGAPQPGSAPFDPSETAIKAWFQELDVPTDVVQGKGSWPIRAGISWLLKNRLVGSFAPNLVTALFHDIGVYTDVDGGQARQLALNVVIDEMERVDPSVVVAHSLGSVVAYEALWSRPDLQIDMLVTLGSPLALPGVFYGHFAIETANQNRRPPNVKRWVNIADVGDFIAVPQHLSRFFEGIAAADDQVTNLGFFEPHRAVPYLRCRELAAALRSTLTSGPRCPTKL